MRDIIKAAEEWDETSIEKLNWLCEHAEIVLLEEPRGMVDLEIKIRTATNLLYEKLDHLDNGLVPELAVLHAITLSFDAGFSVPLWAHKKMAEACSSCIKSQGKKRLEDVLGITVKQGKFNDPFDRLHALQKEMDIVNDVVFLSEIVGFSRQFSYKFIAYKGIKPRLPNVTEVFLDAETIRGIYKKSNRKERKNWLLNSQYFKRFSLQEIFEMEYEERFLSLYDGHSGYRAFLTKKQLDLAKEKYKQFMGK